LEWKHFKSNQLVFLINQEKTQVEHRIELHEVARTILERRYNAFSTLPPQGKVFKLPSQDISLRTLDSWCKDAGIEKAHYLALNKIELLHFVTGCKSRR